MKKLIPNPNYEKAELAFVYFDHKQRLPMRGLRFWAKDRRKLSDLMMDNNLDEIHKLAVPMHIEVDEL